MWGPRSATTYAAAYTHDLASQLMPSTDPAATYNHAHDKLGREPAITSTLSRADSPGPVTLTQTFDLADNRTGLAAALDTASTTMADFTNQYTYDRLTRVAQAGVSGGNAVSEKRVDFSYAADSQPTAITRYQDLARTKLVAPDNRLQSDVTDTYTYAKGSRNRGTYLISGRVTDYTWDRRNRLVRGTVPTTDQGQMTKDIPYTTTSSTAVSPNRSTSTALPARRPPTDSPSTAARISSLPVPSFSARCGWQARDLV